MYIYISIFFAILLCFVVVGYFFFPNSQFSLSFRKKTFVLTTILLSVVFLYFLSFGIYDLMRDHQEMKVVQIDDKSHIVNGIDGKLMFLQDKKIRAGVSYKTVLFSWVKMGDNAKIVIKSDEGKKIVLTDSINMTPNEDSLYQQIQLSLNAKYLYGAAITIPTPGKWQITFGDSSAPIGTLSVEVYK
ncbi:MAG: hypothetical protein ACO1OC_06035 [Tuberibacillus sp.]